MGFDYLYAPKSGDFGEREILVEIDENH